MSDELKIDDGAARDDAVAAQPKAGQSSGQRLGLALVLISIAQLMVVLDATIANIALPFIGKDLDISGINLTWIVTGYTLVFGGFLLLGGRLADLYGRRRIFMIGLVVFAVGSLLGGLAQSELLLLGARGIQGFGAALASPAALALITTTFPAGPARNRAFAVYAAMSGAGAAVGLILGGWLTGSNLDLLGLDIHGWRLTFLINVPIGIVAALLAPRFLPESESHPGQLDIPGAITGTAGLLAIVFGLTHAGNPTYGWSDPWTITSLIAGAVLIALFVAVESRVAHPLLPFRIFANQTRAASFVAMALLPAAMFAMFFFLSLFIQNVMGYSPLKTGVAFLPFSVGIVISAAHRLQPGEPHRRALHRRCRHAGRLGRPLRVLPARGSRQRQQRRGGGAERAVPRRRRQLLDADPAVHRADGAGHGRGVRAAHPDRRPPRARRGLRHRLGRAQHDAAGRRRAGPGDPGHRGESRHDRAHRGDRPGCR